MRLINRVKALIVSVLIGGSFAGFTLSPAIAQKTVNFTCETIGGTPVTFARINQGESRQFIRWTSPFGSAVGYTPQTRCAEVTGRLNTSFSQGGQYITHGRMNNQNVICFTNYKGNGCNQLFYTLKPEDDPKAVLEDLFALNNNNFAGRPRREAPCSTYVNINDILAGKRVVAEEVCAR
ncbi:COP23 domain-containing protein [Aerosakkonema funiforme]|uniref:Uncharacterized protein n=1 Tax=Aerosakkonema funiforme FACHB-1375 TaxID=2949571 RepID=A0A926VBF7_9CYAN|nr:COP23 domain-containing protein [Aerosakkonema funiforme]MBD2180733.1 hypothetical protein [Aerosakkonema funiforme FACHB-1375]